MFGSLTVKQEGGGAFLQCGDGGVAGLGSEHDAQRRVLDVDGGDDGGGHAGGVAGCLGGVGVEQLLEGAGGRAGVVGKCIGDLGAAVTEFGSGAAGLDDGDADTEGANSWATDSVDPSMPHLVTWYIELPGKATWPP